MNFLPKAEDLEITEKAIKAILGTRSLPPAGLAIRSYE